MKTKLLKPCPHCRRKVRLSHKSETVAEKCDCRRIRRKSPFSATVWTGLYIHEVNVTAVTLKMQPRRQIGGSVLQLYRTSYAVRSAFLTTATLLLKSTERVVLVVQRFGVGLVIERSLLRLPAEALPSQLGQLSLPSLRGIGKSSTSLHGWG